MKSIKLSPKLILTQLSLYLCLNVLGQSNQPNIVIIQVDDMGFDDLSINGNTLSQTPNIDALSKESVRFSNFMVNSVCAPSRASLLTGRDFWKTGVSAMHGGKDYLNKNETTFANIFQNEGYKTGMWGKWHSGKSDGYWPWDRGFDDGYYAELYKYYPSWGWHNSYPKKIEHKDKWTPEVIVDYAIDFISKNKKNPFLAYVSFMSVHEHWKTPKAYKRKFMKEGITERFATLLGMLSFMDDEIGRLLNELTKQGLDDNTIVLFMSDNGPNRDKQNKKEWALRNNHNYLGNKARLWQNGLKSPLYVRWNNHFKPKDVERLVSITDIFPTLLNLANLELPSSNLPIDGRSVVPYFQGDIKSLPEKTAIFSHWHPFSAKSQWEPLSAKEKSELSFNDQHITIMDEHYKYLFNVYKVDGGPNLVNNNALIDLKNDPMESKNIIKEYPEIAKKYEALLKNWFTEIVNTEGTFNSPEFEIGWNGKSESEIRAYGPSETNGMTNENLQLTGMNKVGDYAIYSLNVHEEGTYKIDLEFNKRANLKKGFVITVNSGLASVTKELTDDFETELGSLYLSKGKQTLQLKLIKNLNNPEGLGAMKAIYLKRIKR